MTSLHNSASTLDNTMPAIPMRITHSFPPKGIVANILTSNKNTKAILRAKEKAQQLLNGFTKQSANGTSLYLYGSLKEHLIPMATRAKMRNEDVSFSLPPTLTEKAFKTRKTPRFYTIDTSSLRQQNNKIDQALNQLITNSDSADLKEIYHKICKGNISTLQTLISKKKISQKFVFVQNSSPITRHPHQTRIITAAKKQEPEQRTVEQQCGNRENETPQKTINKRVLVPSSYFNRANNEKAISPSSEVPSQHILYSNSFFKHHKRKSPIEPTVINLNDKLPELGKDRNLNSRFPAKNRTLKRPGGS